ncbi:hypothetical protein BS50DRAFT_621729 [Corynespora cassiicola Philippines]|uniref:Uncharacterized protein n=1 Tax=Corynespora cassiicola Philippines TaxID=1448308 RepID=A0A2T2NKK4_CORCC|nr:hypothetical protein BS50DRAFT_621729 [Corynespora cassiicola Philippines]
MAPKRKTSVKAADRCNIKTRNYSGQLPEPDEPIGYVSDTGEEGTPHDDPLIKRIYSGIEYVSEQIRMKRPIRQWTRFTLPVFGSASLPSPTLYLLRQAYRRGYANCIALSDKNETYDIGMPPPDLLTEGSFDPNGNQDWTNGAYNSKYSMDNQTMQPKMSINKPDKDTKHQQKIDGELAERLRVMELNFLGGKGLSDKAESNGESCDPNQGSGAELSIETTDFEDESYIPTQRRVTRKRPRTRFKQDDLSDTAKTKNNLKDLNPN